MVMIYNEPVLHQFALVVNGIFYTMDDLADQGYVLISIDDAFTSDTKINNDEYIGLNRDVLNSQFFQGRRIMLRFSLEVNRNWLIRPFNRYFVQGSNIQLIYYKNAFTLDTSWEDAIDNDNVHIYSNNDTYVFDGVIAMCTLSPFQSNSELDIEIYMPDPFIRKMKTYYSVPLYLNNTSETGYKILAGFRNSTLSEYPTIGYTVPISLVDADTTSQNYFIGKAYPFWVKRLTDDITYNAPGIQFWTAQLIINDAIKRASTDLGINIFVIKQRRWHSPDTPDLYETSQWTSGVEYAKCSIPSSDLTGKTLTGGAIYQYVNPYQLKATISWSGGSKTYDFTEGTLRKKGAFIDTFYLAIQTSAGMGGSFSLLNTSDTKPWINYYGSYMSLDQID